MFAKHSTEDAPLFGIDLAPVPLVGAYTGRSMASVDSEDILTDPTT